MYHIGKITTTHGIKGEVKIYNLSDFNRFSVGAQLYVMHQGQKKYFTVEHARTQGKLLIVKFKEYNDINDMLVFKGFDVYSDEDKQDELGTDDFHYHALIDKSVYTDNDQYIGKVTALIPVPQGHLLEVLKQDDQKIMIPFVRAFVSEVRDDRIIITPIEGLL